MKQTTTHAPGPWTIHESPEGDTFFNIADKTDSPPYIASVFGDSASEAKQTARLIASAPELKAQNKELLEALEGIERACKISAPYGEDVRLSNIADDARNAINKARGQHETD